MILTFRRSWQRIRNWQARNFEICLVHDHKKHFFATKRASRNGVYFVEQIIPITVLAALLVFVRKFFRTVQHTTTPTKLFPVHISDIICVTSIIPYSFSEVLGLPGGHAIIITCKQKDQVQQKQFYQLSQIITDH